MYRKLKDFFLNRPWTFLIIYALLAIIATVQAYYGGVKKFSDLPYDYTGYNNYLIFKQSFFHLIEGKDLYSFYSNEYWDLYKYSPTFALLFGVLACLPDGLGLLLWNLINALALFFGVRLLTGISLQLRNTIFLLATVELFTSLQNSQSNALVTGLIVLAFALMEKERFIWACFCIALTVYIKIFGLFAFALCLLYRQRWKMIGYSIVAMIVLAVLPLLIISASQLQGCYESWWVLLQSDYVPNLLSLVSVINIWFGVKLAQNLVLITGVFLFLISMIRIRFYTDNRFRLLMLAMILLWMVIFNHKVESPTFIIAFTGIGLWYVSSGLAQQWKIALTLMALVFTSLSPTDLFPGFIQENYFDPWAVKTIPCIVIYFVVFYELTFRPNQFISQ